MGPIMVDFAKCHADSFKKKKKKIFFFNFFFLFLFFNMHNGWSRLGFVLAHAGHVMILSIIACEIIYQISVPSAMPYPATLRVDSAVM
jgi:hypothetical protein